MDRVLFYVVPFYAGFFMNEKYKVYIVYCFGITFRVFVIKKGAIPVKTAEHTLSGNGMEHTQGELFGFGWFVLYHYYYYDYIYGCISLKYFRVNLDRSMPKGLNRNCNSWFLNKNSISPSLRYLDIKNNRNN